MYVDISIDVAIFECSQDYKLAKVIDAADDFGRPAD